jgi:hypothetical protein
VKSCFFSKEVKPKQEAATRKSIETSNHPEKIIEASVKIHRKSIDFTQNKSLNSKVPAALF